MQRTLTHLTWLVAILVLTFAASIVVAQEPDEEGLVGLSGTWQEAYNAQDLDALAELYTEDAVLMPPNGERMRGHAAMRALTTSYLEAGAVRIETPPPDAYGLLGDTAWAEGTYRFFREDGSPLDVGKYLAVYRYEDGAWKMQHHMWSSDLPPMPAP
jgi:uncharacterized protein (TIGR02246 family)